jgi:hypothetical protein
MDNARPYQVDKVKWDRFKARIRKMDAKAQLLIKKPDRVHCSCGSVIKVKQLYDTTRFNQHKATCSPGTSLFAYFELSAGAAPGPSVSC